VVSLLIFWDRPLSLTLSLQTHLGIFLHAFTDLWTGTTHTFSDQQNRKTEFKTCTLPFMKISREHNLSGSRVYIKNQTSIKVWPLRSKLSVFTRSFEPLTRSTIECNNACLSSLCWTRDLWPNHPWIQNVLRKYLTLDNLIPRFDTTIWKDSFSCENDQQHCWSQLLFAFSLDILILFTFRISPLTFGTHSDHNQQHRCKALQPKSLIPNTHSPWHAHSF